MCVAIVAKQRLLFNGVALMNLLILSVVIVSVVAVFLFGALVDHVLHDGLAIHVRTFLHG
jgi:hypothetical protein